MGIDWALWISVNTTWKIFHFVTTLNCSFGWEAVGHWQATEPGTSCEWVTLRLPRHKEYHFHHKSLSWPQSSHMTNTAVVGNERKAVLMVGIVVLIKAVPRKQEAEAEPEMGSTVVRSEIIVAAKMEKSWSWIYWKDQNLIGEFGGGPMDYRKQRWRQTL